MATSGRVHLTGTGFSYSAGRFVAPIFVRHRFVSVSGVTHVESPSR